MQKNKKVIHFIKKASKVIDRSQTEILQDRKEKREAVLKRLKSRKP